MPSLQIRLCIAIKYEGRIRRRGALKKLFLHEKSVLHPAFIDSDTDDDNTGGSNPKKTLRPQEFDTESLLQGEDDLEKYTTKRFKVRQ